MAKRAPDGSGSISKRSDDLWQGKVSIGIDPGTGKPKYKYFSNKEQKIVREWVRQTAAAVDKGTYSEPSKMTVGQWLDIWTAEYLGGVKYGTQKTYKAQVTNHIKPAFKVVKLQQLKPHQIQKFYNALQRDNGLSAKTVRNVHGVLTKALSTAHKLGYIQQNPCDMVTTPRIEKYQFHTLNDEQVKDFVQASTADGSVYAALYKVLVFTGMRIGEGSGLTWDCVNFGTGTITIEKQLQRRPERDGGFVLAPLKNDRPRTIKPPRFVMDTLRERHAAQMRERLKAGSAWTGWKDTKEQATALVFTNLLGAELYPRTIAKHHKIILQKIGVDDLTVHDLRHTYATLALQNGIDVKTVSQTLGHATAAFTLDIYAAVTERMYQESADKMQGYIDSFTAKSA
ncbi:MAG: site-specific integrase [Oscillospiraceae bacterium]|nr:site-specific integrase [Oscillospiraceae bacterium]